MYNVTLSQKL